MPVKAPSIVDQYELGSTAFDEALDSAHPPAEPQAPAPASNPAPVPPAKPAHSARLLRQAQDLGMAQEEIDRLPSDQLDELVYHLNRQQLQMAREFARADLVTGATERRSSAAGVSPPPAASPSAAPAPADEYQVDLDPQEYDPKLISTFKKQGGEIQALKKELESYRQREQLREQESMRTKIDRLFAALKDPYFGTASFAEAKPEELARRVAVLDQVDRMERQRLPGTFEEKFSKAVGVFRAPVAAPAAPAAPANGAARISQDQWNQAGLAVPTVRAAEEPKGPAKALKTAATFMRDHGMGDTEEMTEEGFLD